MNSNEEWTVEQVAEALTWTKQQLAEIEQQWKELRAYDRALCIRLVTQHGFSVAKTALISGHDRRTLKVWLDLWNAEQKSKKK